MVIWWSTPATRQLAAAHEYIAADNKPVAAEVTNHIWDSVDMLARHPKAGRDGRVLGTRELVITGTPFVVAYRIQKNEVRVLAVLHAAREWPEEFE
ncbi:MAG: type II toxin-antitoxin system RelE/ParE family toxin [Terriglobales bacterium]